MFWKVSCWLFRKKWPVRDIYHLALLISKLDETNENKYFKNRIESVYYLSRFMNKKTEKIWKNVLNKFEFINSSIRQCVLIQKIKKFLSKNQCPWNTVPSISADVPVDEVFWAAKITSIFINLAFYDSIKRESIFLRKKTAFISESGADHNCLITLTG